MRFASIAVVSCFVGLFTVGACSSDDNKTTPATTDGGGGDGSSSGEGGSKTDAPSKTDGATSTCVPADVASFTPEWKPPTPFNQGKCTATMVDTLVECAFGNRDANCDAIEENPDNLGCLNCLFTERDAANWGPIIFLDDETGIVNEGGCVGNAMNETAAGGCGAKLAALGQCTSAACDEACPGDTEEDLAAYDACVEASYEGGCNSHYEASACADEAIDTGGIAEKCYVGDDFGAWAKGVGILFCAGGGDGGSDAPTDGG